MRSRQAHRCRFEELERRTVLSAASVVDVEPVAMEASPLPTGCACGGCGCCLCAGEDLHGVDAYGNEYHAIPLPDFDRLAEDEWNISQHNAPSFTSPSQLEQLAETFHLHSNPDATHTVYLDFTGHTTSGTFWNSSFNGGNDIVTAAYDFTGDAGFSNSELQRIQHIWQRVAEDFAPFDVNVTTQDPGAEDLRNSGGDDAWGIRVVIGGSGSWYGSAGGVAYLNSFDWGSDTPVFVFENNLANGHERYTAEAISHEVGHALGLSHDGDPSSSYYSGHGSGATGWASIMGVGYYQQLTQWSQGEYAGADNGQDDLAIITSGNGFGYRADDHGDAGGAATGLTVDGNNAGGAGIIEQNTDVDVFSFTTTGGTLDLDFSPAARGANLDMLVELYDASNNLIASSNPADALGASLNDSLAAGEYFIHITGTGKGDPLGTGYTDYGSLGQYSISGTIDGLADMGALAFAGSAAPEATFAPTSMEAPAETSIHAPALSNSLTVTNSQHATNFSFDGGNVDSLAFGRSDHLNGLTSPETHADLHAPLLTTTATSLSSLHLQQWDLLDLAFDGWGDEG